MTTQERLDEANRASTVFHVALNQIGAKAFEDATSLWADVPPVPGVAGTPSADKWLGAAVLYVKRRRLRARDLALAYYRYERALITGKTIALPGQPKPPYMTLPELKREFEAYLHPEPTVAVPANETVDTTQEVTPADPTPATSEPANPSPSEPSVDPVVDEIDPSDRILLEEIENLEQELREMEDLAEQQIRDALENLGPRNQDKKLKQIKHESVEKVDEDRRKAHKEAGNRQAASAAREVMNGARGTVHHIGTKDRRAIGFVRVSRTGTPCGWCAMLISRGPVLKYGRPSGLYRSAQGTGQQADGTIVTFGDLDLYHDNCHCYAVPIFSMEQYNSDPLFALNRKYAEQWPQVTQGLGGKSAVSAWRRFIRQEAKSHKSQEAAA